jgi:hypothetical protein
MTLLRSLAGEASPANIDRRPLVGREPWWRARTGDHRVIYRRLTRDEARILAAPLGGVFVERVIDRRDLEGTTKRL